MTRMDFTALFYNQVHDCESLLTGLDSLLSTEVHTLTIVPYASDQSPAKCFKTGDRNRGFDLLSTYEGVELFELVFHPPRAGSDPEAISGRFFVCKHPSFPEVFMVMTIESVDFVQRALLPFIERNRPQFYLTFLRHDDLGSLLKNFRMKHGFSDLRVVRASVISRFAGGVREATIPSVSWPRLGLVGAFEYAREQNGWFRSLTFELLKDSRVFAEATIHRNGIIKTDGEFRSIYNSLILPICHVIHDNVELFAKRSRRENPQLNVRPLTIEFARDQFENIEENAKFIEAMRQLNNASVSVMHGNPYISMAIVDYVDGSTFDLWVLNSSEVVIVPQLKSSIASIKRVISHVFDNYAEGIIRDFQISRQ
jgi:hypothetical protein